LFWKKSNMPAAVTSLIVGSALRLAMFFVIPLEWAGLDTMIPPPISFALFIIVALATQKKYPGKQRHGINDYIPPEEDIVIGEDLKHFQGGNLTMSGGSGSTNSPDNDDSSRTAMGK